jgi:elongation factor P
LVNLAGRWVTYFEPVGIEVTHDQADTREMIAKEQTNQALGISICSLQGIETKVSTSNLVGSNEDLIVLYFLYCAIISRRFSGKRSNLRGAMAETISTNQFRNGAAIRVDGKRFTIMYFQHVKPGKGGAFVRTRLRNLDTGAVIERTFRAGEKVESVRTESRPMQFLYRDGDLFYFMDSGTYEQLAIPVEIIGEAAGFIVPNGEAKVLSADGEVVSVEPPAHVDLEVAETDPGLKGDTATGGSKPATLETGVVVQVPLFVNVGERVRVDTRTNEYLTRV